MPLSEQEQHALAELEHGLRADDPRLDKWLRRMTPPEDSTSTFLTLAILAAAVVGVGLLVAGWVLFGLLALVLGAVGPIRWVSRSHYDPACHHLVPASEPNCPRCAAA
ncbi:hypothetical protein DI005_22960 [Prauserella sp. PE36]|uniref:DUF3040 domain-containing protein n=1 Tax=Prauserella endophytica TaxID=1592324 RepID=A0ABY2S9F3_9PSEU|nr:MULTISPECIES: DUF3040 domain-containing protein [Prauserella]PXY23088.1 hypothetical protein BAY59_25570 [Prauserella coralliicola]RBM17153.1 hypothetical protein DI005_22960 [Prauserella sp. PE36]TKG72520.1 DUF3040 domain-containing protein [Prauserella endophytica]